MLIIRPIVKRRSTPCLVPNWAHCLSNCMDDRYTIFVSDDVAINRKEKSI